MTASLNALDGEKIAAGISRSLGLIERTDLPAGQRATAVRQLDQRRVRVGPEKVNDPHAARRRCHCLRIDIGGQEVRREHSGGLIRHAGKDRVEIRRRHPLGGDAPDTARIGHRGRQRGRRHRAHRRLLYRHAAACQLGERRRQIHVQDGTPRRLNLDAAVYPALMRARPGQVQDRRDHKERSGSESAQAWLVRSALVGSGRAVGAQHYRGAGFLFDDCGPVAVGM